ncbi:MAG: FAD-dependent oxidoreductase [Antricoccus sp.]
MTVFKGKATFVGPKTLDTGTGETITAERIVIAAGGHPQMLDVPGLDQPDPDHGIHTNDSIMRLTDLPERIIIVGGGYIAAEFANVFGGLGSAVTWIQRSERLLRSQDETISTRYTELAAAKYDLRLGARPIKAEQVGDEVQLTCASAEGEFMVSAPVVLVAIGRVPYANDLDVKAAGVAQHDDGRIKVDSYQQTSVEGIFALGDISSDFQLKHVANREAKTVKYNLAHPESMMSTDHRVVPFAVFSHPQIASFGATEQQLKAAGAKYLVKVQDYGDVAYGWAMEDKTGIVKLLADPSTRQLLGAHIMGHEASMLIQPLIQGAQFNQTVDQIATEQYWIHPALTEVIENALLGLEPNGD